MATREKPAWLQSRILLRSSLGPRGTPWGPQGAPWGPKFSKADDLHGKGMARNLFLAIWGTPWRRPSGHLGPLGPKSSGADDLHGEPWPEIKFVVIFWTIPCPFGYFYFLSCTRKEEIVYPGDHRKVWPGSLKV